MNSDFAIWLYGSHARGTADEHSDHDILVVSDEKLEPMTVRELIRADYTVSSISDYTWEQVHKMSEYGSLFLHHLRLDGETLIESHSCKGRLRNLLEQLVPYKRARTDLDGFKTVLADTRYSISHGGSMKYELSVLTKMVRHAAILGCYVIGTPLFGRYEPVSFLSQEWNLKTEFFSRFRNYYVFCMAAEGRVEAPNLPTYETVTSWLEGVDKLLNHLSVAIHEYETNMPSVYR